ncbi:phosphatidylglycerol lysyltransferase [Rhodobacter sp. JA431]|uniref:bifunctional lysylphosphatidylglycerol flippase/synthetase MprF n=1 Tax=Rhodobacter sp. JA431 TaxID=570013 RepID=UPI000BD84E8D|nr:bifunctional lysylphosphatidylglycerol flippase/synthetase MprF [Rhodobacter sp. JA431]SOC14123.1 phosphatidylglycerol lysyltransferase [Rhodobacter sp. JA431]
MSKREAGAASPGKLRHLGPVLLGFSLFGLGIWALQHLLKEVSADEIIAQINATPNHIFAIALGATALGYTALIGYDFWALKYLEKKLPLRVVALGGFLGYAFGNTIGISVLSGGAVRYRIYSAFGLNAFEVAALASYIAIAMGTGLSLVGVFALALHPAALTGLLPLSEEMVRLLALSGGLATVALLFGLGISGKVLRLGKYEISMPRPHILTGQMVVALFDSTMAALTLYVLLPQGAPDFVTFLAIYATATMVGVMSHVPGGVGVFETVVMAAMPAGTAVGDVAAALLMFRLIYYLIPFALAFVIVSLNEARLAGGWAVRLFGEISDPMRPAFNAVAGMVPWLSGAWAFGLGAYLLALALWPSVPTLHDSDDLVGAILLEGGTLVSSVAGAVLLILSHGLIRRVAGAFWLTIAAIGGGIVAVLLNNFDIESATLLAAGALLMWPFRREFYREAKITEGVLGPAWIAMVTAVIIAVALFFIFVHAATPYSHSLWVDFAQNANTPRSLRAGLVGSAILVIFTTYLALQPLAKRSPRTPGEALQMARKVIDAQSDPTACLALAGDKELTFSGDGSAFLMFARRRKSWIAMGDPVGDLRYFDDLGWDFVEAAQQANCRPVFYEISERQLPRMIEMGLAAHKVGEEAVVNLSTFTLSGARFKSMRAAFNKAQREGLDVEVLQPPHAPELIEELRPISDAWLGDKVGHEKSFSVGRFDPIYLRHFPIAVVRRAGKAIAFASIMAPGSGQRVAVDLMRYRPEDASGMIEFLFLSLIAHYQAQGAQEFSLGMAPLAGLSARRTARLWSRFGALMFRHGGAFYNFEGLRAFKAKFNPEWRPRYIALPVGVSPMVAMADVTMLISGGPRGLLKRK